MASGSKAHLLFAFALAVVVAWPPSAAAQTPTPIDVAAKEASRNEAARSLVPLLSDVRRRASGGVTVKPGTVPDSPFAGTQTTLFAFTLSKRSVPVDPAVVKAMDRLIAWKIGAPNQEAEIELFDEWVGELAVKAAALGVGARPIGGCDSRCVAERMTKLDDTWGTSPKDRSDYRDEVLLDALVDAVGRQK